MGCKVRQNKIAAHKTNVKIAQILNYFDTGVSFMLFWVVNYFGKKNFIVDVQLGSEHTSTFEHAHMIQKESLSNTK